MSLAVQVRLRGNGRYHDLLTTFSSHRRQIHLIQRWMLPVHIAEKTFLIDYHVLLLTQRMINLSHLLMQRFRCEDEARMWWTCRSSCRRFRVELAVHLISRPVPPVWNDSGLHLQRHHDVHSTPVHPPGSISKSPTEDSLAIYGHISYLSYLWYSTYIFLDMQNHLGKI